MNSLFLADLHLGKKITLANIEYDFYIEKILNEIIELTKLREISNIFILGDIFDNYNPPASSVKIFYNFLYKISKNNVNSFIITGNHDSNDKLLEAKSFLEEKNIFIFTKVNENFDVEGKNFSIKGNKIDFGTYKVLMLPFVSSARVGKSISLCLDSEINLGSADILFMHQAVDDFKGFFEDISNEYYFTKKFLSKKFKKVISGHIHKNMEIENILYIGNIFPVSVKEAFRDKEKCLYFMDRNFNFEKITLEAQQFEIEEVDL